MLDKGMISCPGQDRARFHHATQNSKKLKTYELFVSGIFHLIFSNCSLLQVTKTTESETAGKGWGTYSTIVFKVFNLRSL